jgi:hypothetical protein
MRYLIKVDYYCETARKESRDTPKWVVIESEKMPRLGVINNTPFKDGPLPNHNCKIYYNNDGCDSDISCNWQEILDIKPFSEQEARRLNAKQSLLEAKC